MKLKSKRHQRDFYSKFRSTSFTVDSALCFVRGFEENTAGLMVHLDILSPSYFSTPDTCCQKHEVKNIFVYYSKKNSLVILVRCSHRARDNASCLPAPLLLTFLLTLPLFNFYMLFYCKSKVTTDITCA